MFRTQNQVIQNQHAADTPQQTPAVTPEGIVQQTYDVIDVIQGRSANADGWVRRTVAGLAVEDQCVFGMVQHSPMGQGELSTARCVARRDEKRSGVATITAYR